MRRPLVVRLVALAAATVLVTAQLGSVAHDESEHTVCPEHGETIHAEAVAAHEERPAWTAHRGAETDHAEHCGILTTLHAHASDFAPSQAASPLGEALRSVPTPVLATGIPLLHLAPKASPPASV